MEFHNKLKDIFDFVEKSRSEGTLTKTTQNSNHLLTQKD